MEDESVDSIVCDPPYELGFMGKSWDSTGIAYDVEVWKQCLRVLKPGGHLLAFGGSRTYHRLACAIEDAGFDIRDQIQWIYGSGFPKSLDVSKSIDKAARGVPQGGADPTSANHGKFKGGCSEDNPSGQGFGAGPGQFMKDSRSKYDGANRKPAPSTSNGFGYESKGGIVEPQPLTEDAKQWNGWGTALKPSHEPIVLARKPLIGTVASNVLQHGTGALNIDACRIEGEPVPINRLENWSVFGQEKRPDYEQEINTLGRWPANVIHDGSDEVLALFPNTYSSPESSTSHEEYVPNNKNNVFGESMGGGWHPGFGDGGSAARFFYCAKASQEDRDEGMEEFPLQPCGMMEDDNYPIKTSSGKVRNTERRNIHPTVKPTDLMRYLCRLVTRPGGTVLDPFMGSGSTYKAAYQEGLNFAGIEISEPYCAIAVNRVVQNVFNFNA
jgi:site-specific DNA-methyltransferase (adenine-specific)